MLAFQPDDRLLEIGCGGGVAVSLICDRLESGTITAIDRSPIQVGRAVRRNEQHVASGKATIRAALLEDLGVEEGPFSKVFAINVNLFWVRSPEKELDRIRKLLGPGAALHLFYDPPDAAKASATEEKLTAALGAAAFDATATNVPAGSSHLLAVVAQPR
jgi:trans-aconitate methyltransferase